jgi:hypothetical protein
MNSIVNSDSGNARANRALRNSLIVSIALHALVFVSPEVRLSTRNAAVPLRVSLRAADGRHAVASPPSSGGGPAAAIAPEPVLERVSVLPVPERRARRGLERSAVTKLAKGAAPAGPDEQLSPSELDPASLRAFRVALVLAVGAGDPPQAVSGRATLRLRFAAGQFLGAVVDPGSGDEGLDRWLVARFERGARAMSLPAAFARGRFEIELPVEWSDG